MPALPLSQVTIAAEYPPSGSVVSVNTIPFIVFSAPVNSSSIMFSISGVGGSLTAATPSYNSGIFTYTIVPNVPLNSLTNYTAVFVSGLDISGTGLINGQQYPFSTTYARTNNVGCWGWGASC